MPENLTTPEGEPVDCWFWDCPPLSSLSDVVARLLTSLGPRIPLDPSPSDHTWVSYELRAP